MASFAQLRGRIGVAGMLLRKLPMGSAVHSAQSEIQAAAVLSVLQSHGHQLTADEKARLSSMIAASAFAEKDALAIASRCACTRTQRLMMLMTFGAVTMGQICGKRARAPDGVCPKALPSTGEVFECPNCGTYLLISHRPVDNAFGYRLRCACRRWVMRGCYSDLVDDYDHQE